MDPALVPLSEAPVPASQQKNIFQVIVKVEDILFVLNKF